MFRSAEPVTALRSVTRKLFERLQDVTVDADAAYVVAPSSTEEGAAVLAAAAEAGIPTTFLGGGTRRELGGSVSADLVVTTTRLASVVDWRPDDLTAVVGAGLPIDDLEAEIAQRSQTAVLPETAPGSTVGGVIAAGMSGYRRLRYGPTRDRVLEVRMATGYGKAVTGGSPVVKSSTGYGVARLATGSLGSLGLIGEVTLKLWSRPRATSTVSVGDAAAAYRITYRPLSVLETSDGAWLYLGGSAAQIAAQAAAVGGIASPGLAWPEPISEPVQVEMRVPAAHLRGAIRWAQRIGATRWIAQHGVGIVSAGLADLDMAGISAARTWAESVSGTLVILAGADNRIDPWGTPPASLEIQRRIKAAFDPSGICNASILPGGL